jgi:hypothetical protein
MIKPTEDTQTFYIVKFDCGYYAETQSYFKWSFTDNPTLAKKYKSLKSAKKRAETVEWGTTLITCSSPSYVIEKVILKTMFVIDSVECVYTTPELSKSKAAISQKMIEEIKVGDIVSPISCGLWLADAPVDGNYYQKRNRICVFKDKGKVLRLDKVIIDYDEWDEQDIINGFEGCMSVGKLECINLLIVCDAGTGWAGAGAVTKVKEEI